MSQVVVELPGVAGDSQPLHECGSMVSKKQLHVQGHISVAFGGELSPKRLAHRVSAAWGFASVSAGP